MKLELKEIRKRFDDAQEQDRENREEALDDLQFAAGEQWPEEEKRARENASRPVLTINRMPQFIRQVTGDIRRTNPAIDVLPGDGDADDEMAETLAGIIRGIEYQCDAPSVYEGAAESAAACGMGHWRANYRQEGGENEIYVERIHNPFAVVWDPLAKDPTRKDARYCFVTEELTLEDFREQFPKASTVDFGNDDLAATLGVWYAGETIQIADYYWKDGGQVFVAKVSGAEILEEPRPFPSKHIPIFTVVGEETHIGNRVVRTSVIRHAKDPQRLYNYSRSTASEIIALQPKAPYKVTPKQIEGFESFWNTANRTNYAYLPYNPDERAPGAPQRETPPVASSGLMNEIMLAADDMKATTGIYDAALGNAGNEKSGVAIKQRQIESDISTSIYVDNLSKSIAQCGRVMLDMISALYDTTRRVRTVGVDGQPAMAELNVPVMTQFGPVYMNDPSFGKYDVRIKTGPSYTTQRQEAVDAMIEFVRAFPAAAAVAGDLVARNMDWPGAEDLAERLAKALPPGMVEKKPEDMTPEEQQAAMQAQAQQQQRAQLEQMLAQMELQKEQAEAAEAEADATKAQVEAQQAQMELAASNGQLNEVIAQIVQQEVARVLQSMQRPMIPIN